MSEWTEETRESLKTFAKTGRFGFSLTSLVAAALAHIDRLTAEVERLSSGLTPSVLKRLAEHKERAEAAEAKLAEAQTSIKLQAAALDVWKAANPDGTGGMLGVLAAEREKLRKLRDDVIHYARRCAVHAPECRRCMAIWDALRDEPEEPKPERKTFVHDDDCPINFKTETPCTCTPREARP